MANSIKEIAEEDAIPAWHWILADRKFRYEPYTPIEAGKTYVHSGPIRLCYSGLHASRRPLDGLKYATGNIITRVRCWGRVIECDDKLVCDRREVLWIADAGMLLHMFACATATNALDLVESKGIRVDPRSRKAIEVKQLWVAGKATDKELAAARDAAWDATRAAAWDATRAAAWDAVRAAARDAAWEAARAAARDAAWDEQNRIIESLLLSLDPKG